MSFNLDNYLASLAAMSKTEKTNFLETDQFQPLIQLEQESNEDAENELRFESEPEIIGCD